MKNHTIATIIFIIAALCSCSSQVPEKSPVIGIAPAVSEKGNSSANASYIDAVTKAGGIPIILPPAKTMEQASMMASLVDGMVFPGGEDVNPQWYGEETQPYCGGITDKRDTSDIYYIRAAVAAAKPILGICRGLQVINVALGGSLYQDIPSQVDEPLEHRQTAPRDSATQFAVIDRTSHLGTLLGVDSVGINSFHHQAVKELADGLKITARACDGIVEAIEGCSGPSILAVQFHPEAFIACGDTQFLPIFSDFVSRCRTSAR